MPYCVYAGRDLPDSEPFSREHVLPLSLGGPEALSIRVSTNANSLLGGAADAPLVNNWFIGNHRVRFNLPGQSGTPPSVEVRGHLQHDGKQVPARHRIRPDGQALRVSPSVSREVLPDGSQKLGVQCYSEDDFHRIVRDVNRKNSKKGLAPLDAEALLQAASQVRIDEPVVDVEFRLDATCFHRGFVKMALGIAYLLFGEEYGRSADADRLRQFIWEADSERRTDIGIHGHLFPQIPDPFPLADLLATPDHHVLGVLLGDIPVFGAVLFGEYPGFLALADEERPELRDILGSADRVWLVEPSSRSCSAMSVDDLTEWRSRSQS